MDCPATPKMLVCETDSSKVPTAMSMQRAHFPRIAIVAIVIGIQLLSLGSGAVNEEYVFADAADYLAGQGQHDLRQFFQYQANSLGLSLVASLGLRLLPFMSGLTACRAVVLVGATICLLACGHLIHRRFGSLTAAVWMIALAANPIVWCMFCYGTVDLLPGMLSTLGILLTLEFRREHAQFPQRLQIAFLVLIASVFALSTLFKIHGLPLAFACSSLLLFLPSNQSSAGKGPNLQCANGRWAAWPSNLSFTGPFSCYDNLFQRAPFLKRGDMARSLVVSIPSLAVALAYGCWTQFSFEFFLVPKHFQQAVLDGWIESALLVFPLYLAFLGYLWGPLMLTSLRRLRMFNAWLEPQIVVGFVVGGLAAYGSTRNFGEMNFGVLSTLLPTGLTELGFFVGGFLSTQLIAEFVRNDRFRADEKMALLFCLLLVLALSFSRPSQRYLIFAFPFLIMFQVVELLQNWKAASSKLAVFAYLALFIPLSLVGRAFLDEQGNSARRIVQLADDLGVLCQTDLALIRQHVGDSSRWCRSADVTHNYRVSLDPKGSIAGADMTILGTAWRTYYLSSRIEPR